MNLKENAISQIFEKIKTDDYGLNFTQKVYQKGKFLGKGGFAKCYEIIDD